MMIRLDPALPLVWRTPTSLQLGVDSPVVTLTDVTTAEERMLAALTRGISTEGLRLIGRSSGFTDAQLVEFERRISPALHTEHMAENVTVAVSGSGATLEQLGWRLAEVKLTPTFTGQHANPHDGRGADQTTRAAAFAVIVAHFVIAPHVFGEWLRNDIPHLPIVYGDTRVRIGPIVEPGISPCLYCIERHHTDADPAWPAIATQLLGRRSMAETAFVASEVAVLATRIIRARIDNAPASGALSVTLDPLTGELSSQKWHSHPDCACRDFSEQRGASGPTLQENAKRRSSRRAAHRTGTTRGAVAFAPW